MQLSERLKSIISMVTEGMICADVGTDHGYVPISLIKEKTSPHVIAMDVNKGPLLIAEKNIKDAGFSEYIELRLSDGLKALKPGEAECVIISGMGGVLIKRILSDTPDVLNSVKEMILSPQSDIHEVRKYIGGNGFKIADETMLIDEGKYYTIIKAVRGEEDTYSDIELRYGRRLLNSKNEILYLWLIKRKKLLAGIMNDLKNQTSRSSIARAEEISLELMNIDEALTYYEG